MDFSPNKRKVNDLEDALRSMTIIEAVAPAWLGKVDHAATDLIVCDNGLIHWPSGELIAHTPRFFCHYSVPFAFEPDAGSPEKWLAFLHDIWPDDSPSIDCLQETFGYLLSGDTSIQKIFCLLGPKRAGKGTIAHVLECLLGRHNIVAPTLSSLAGQFGEQCLIGKPLAIITDARLGSKADQQEIVTRLLAISGEDTRTIERKHLPDVTTKLPTRFFIMSNELPRLSDASGALSSRLVTLQLIKSFYGKENLTLRPELAAETPKIFNWALMGLRRLKERGYFQPPSSSSEALQEFEDLASPITAFLRERCVFSPDLSIPKAALYAGYRSWCQATGHSAPNDAVFAKWLKAARPEIRTAQLGGKHDRVRHYVGIALVVDDLAPKVCAHCGEPSDDLRLTAVGGETALLHPKCIASYWEQTS